MGDCGRFVGAGPSDIRHRERHEDAGGAEGWQTRNGVPVPGQLQRLHIHMFDAEVWKPIAEKPECKRPAFTIFGTSSSQLIANGETAAYVRDQMGHSSIKVTFDTYGHLFPGRGKEASDRYEKSMEDARAKVESGC